jgi:DNA polymerase-3 subunit chi
MQNPKTSILSILNSHHSTLNHMQINFYHLTTNPLATSLPVLMEKVLATGSRAVVLCTSNERIAEVDKYFWSVGGTRFLPHGNENEPFKDQQPIYLTTKEENPNGATLLVNVDGASTDFFEKFEKIIDIFDGNNADATASARTRYAEAKKAGHTIKYFKQLDDGKWSEA